MKTLKTKAIIALGAVTSFLFVKEISIAQETPRTGVVVATEQINVGTGYSNAAIILRGWQLQKNNSGDMAIMDLGLAITDVEYQQSLGMVSWKVRMVNFSDSTPTDDIRFSYDYSVILLTDGTAIDSPLPSTVVEKNGLTISSEQISLNILGYQSGAIFPTGFMLHVNPRPAGTVKDFSSEIQNFRFELSDFSYDSGTGLASWKVITDFHDKDGSPKGYRFKYGYTIVLTNGGQTFSRSSGFQTSTSSGSIDGTFNTSSIPQAVVAPIGWELGYASDDQNTQAIGASINNVTVSSSSVSWAYNAILQDNIPNPFRWNIVAGGLIFPGNRIDGHYDSPGHYRFAAMRGPGEGGDTYDDGPTAPGTYIPFQADLTSSLVGTGPLSSDRPPRSGSEEYPAEPPSQGTSNALRVTAAHVVDNAEGDLGEPFANWYIWVFPAEGFDFDRFALFTEGLFRSSVFNRRLFRFAPHAVDRRAVSTFLHGPYLSDSNSPEWGEDSDIGPQYLEYDDLPVWNWDWPYGDRMVIFLWESDECILGFCAPDDPIALFLIERGSTSKESFTTKDLPSSQGVLNAYGDQQLGSITFRNARNPGDIFVNGAFTGSSDGSWVKPFRTVGEGVTAATPNNIISVESGSYKEAITITKPVIIRAHGGSVVIGQ